MELQGIQRKYYVRSYVEDPLKEYKLKKKIIIKIMDLNLPMKRNI